MTEQFDTLNRRAAPSGRVLADPSRNASPKTKPISSRTGIMRQTINHEANEMLKELMALTVDAGYEKMCSRSRHWDQVAEAAMRAINAYGMQSTVTVSRCTALAHTAREVAAMQDAGHDVVFIAQLRRIAEVADALGATETDNVPE